MEQTRKFIAATVGSWGVALLAGALLRLLLFLIDDSLWRDEAKLLMALDSVSLDGLFRELDLGQRAPFGLALIWKGLLAIQADGRHLLRLPSLVAGIAQLAVFAAALRRMVPKEDKTAVVLVWIMALAPNLILFSNQIKPYIFDVFLSTLLVHLALPLLGPGSPSRTRVVFLALTAWAGLFFSYPSWFVVAALCCALALRHGWAGFRTWLGIGLGSLVIVLYIWLSSDSTNSFLQSYWTKGYPRASGWWWFMALAQSLFRGLSSPTFLSTKNLFYLFGWLYLLLLVRAVIRLWRAGERALPALLILPALFCLAAAALHQYPFRDRLILFLTPLVHLLLAFGLPGPDPGQSRPGQSLPLSARPEPGRTLKGVAVWGLGALAFLCGAVSLAEYSQPCAGVRFGLGIVAQEERPGDLLLADGYACQVVEYYRTRDQGRAGFPAARLIVPWADETSQAPNLEPARVAESLPPGSRVWVIAEATGYHRRLRADFRADTRKLVESLSASRQVVYRMEVPRLMLLCFSARQPH